MGFVLRQAADIEMVFLNAIMKHKGDKSRVGFLKMQNEQVLTNTLI